MTKFRDREGYRKGARLVTLLLLCGMSIVTLGIIRPVVGQEAPLSPLGLTLAGPREFLTDSRASLRIVVTDHAQGRPVEGARISVRLGQRGTAATRLLFRGQTDARGTLNASFDLPALAPGDYSLLVQAASGALREQAEQQIRLVQSYHVLLTTDKPIYQPNQVMHLRTLVLRRPDLRAVANQPVTLEVSDARGNKVYKRGAQTNAFGIVSADFQLADEVNMGRYRVRALIGEQQTEKTVTVERYVLPKFKLTLNTNRDWYLPGNHVQASVHADYFFGKPVAGARVLVVAKTFDVEYREIARSEGLTDDEGGYYFDLELPQHFVGQPLEQGQAFLQFEVEVTDTADHTEKLIKTSTVAGAPLQIVAVPEAGLLVPEQENQVYLLVTSPDGKPQPAVVRVTEARGSRAPVEVRESTVQTDETGVGILRLRLSAPEEDSPPWASYQEVRLKLSARSRLGETLEREITLSSRVEPAGSLLLRTDRALYAVGEQITAAAYVSRVEKGTVYFDVIKDRQTVLTLAAEVENGQARVAIPLGAELGGTIYLSAYRILPDSNIIRDVRPLYVEPARDLNIGVQADRDSYLPGSEARLAFSVTDSAGKPVAAALGLSVVDESVFALQELQPGMEKVFFYLEQELMKPRYEIHGIDFPGIITPRPPGPEPVEPLGGEAARQQAARVLLAAARTPELDSFFSDTYAERLAAARERWTEELKPYVERIQRALNTYANRHDGDLPTVEEGISPLLRARLLTTRDVTDPWGNRMTIAPGDSSMRQLYWFVLYSPGPDGKRDTEDDLYLTSLEPSLSFATAAELRQLTRWGWLKGRGGPLMLMDRVEAAGMPAPPPPPSAPATGAPPPATGIPDKETVRVRQFFPETLLFQPALITGEDGKATLTVPMADSITTWRLTALANSAGGQLGSVTSGLRCFQDFFIDLDLPVALTQGDQVSVPVAIYNYLPEAQRVRLELTEAEWFGLKSDRVVEMDIPANNVNVRYFTIVAEKIGDHELTVHGLGEKMSDAITRTIRIEPNGKRTEQAISDRLQESVEHTVTIPERAVAEASTVLVRLFPGVFSTIVDGLDAILQMPFGCFEQTSSATYPNILVLDYMKGVGQINPEIQMKAEGFINTGYQRLVSYEVQGGGFSWFGSAPANKILTAYGLMQFHDMSKVHPVDERLISRTQQWLVKQQEADGAWSADQEYLHQEAWGRVQAQKLAPTAYLTWALAWSGYQGEALPKAVSYLQQHRKQAEDPYLLAMLANALVSADNLLHKGELQPVTVQVLEALLAKARREEAKTWWESQMTGITHSSGNQADLEGTGMAAMAFLTAGRYPDVAGEILNYLNTKRDPRGTWGSTQATVLSLRALALSASGRTTRVKGEVQVVVNGQVAGKHDLTPENSDVVWQVDCRNLVKPGENRVQIRFAGEGTTLYQVISRYYMPWERRAPAEEPLSIAVAYDRTNLETQDEVTARATVRNNLPATTSMIIVDLGIPPGFAVNLEDFAQLVEQGTIDKFTPTGRQVIVYLERLSPRQTVELRYRLTAKYPIRAQTPSSVVYEYYNPDNRAQAAPETIIVQ